MNSQRPLLSDQAYEQVRHAIVTHRLEPGQKLSEASLSEQFNFGKAPIRSAIRRLIEEGMILSRGPKSQIVAPLAMSDVVEIFDFRVLLESEAARRAARNAPIAELRELNERCMQKYTVGDSEEEFAFLEANREFHLAIAKASGSVRLTKWIEQLQDASMRVLWYSLKLRARTEVWSHGHCEIIDALEARDEAASSEKVREHLLNGRQSIIDQLIASKEFLDVRLAPLD